MGSRDQASDARLQRGPAGTAAPARAPDGTEAEPGTIVQDVPGSPGAQGRALLGAELELTPLPTDPLTTIRLPPGSPLPQGRLGDELELTPVARDVYATVRLPTEGPRRELLEDAVESTPCPTDPCVTGRQLSLRTQVQPLEEEVPESTQVAAPPEAMAGEAAGTAGTQVQTLADEVPDSTAVSNAPFPEASRSPGVAAPRLPPPRVPAPPPPAVSLSEIESQLPGGSAYRTPAPRAPEPTPIASSLVPFPLPEPAPLPVTPSRILEMFPERPPAPPAPSEPALPPPRPSKPRGAFLEGPGPAEPQGTSAEHDFQATIPLTPLRQPAAHAPPPPPPPSPPKAEEASPRQRPPRPQAEPSRRRSLKDRLVHLTGVFLGSQEKKPPVWRVVLLGVVAGLLIAALVAAVVLHRQPARPAPAAARSRLKEFGAQSQGSNASVQETFENAVDFAHKK